MRKSTWVMIITLLLYGLDIVTYVCGSNCIALSEGCGCRLDDGAGRFDLTPMTKLKPAPMFDNLQDQYGNTVLIDMCRDFSREQYYEDLKTHLNVTASISAKVFVSSSGANLPVGKTMSYEYDGTLLTIVYAYADSQTGTKLHTRVVMHCSTEDGLGTFSTIQTGDQLLLFSGTLSSKYGCLIDGGSGKKGLSNGTIVCIVLLVLIIVYMVSGILVNKFVRKVEKGDEFPNKNFWKDFPALVKDGFAFTYHQIRRKDAYEPI